MLTKICSKCKIEKELSEFSNDSTKSDGKYPSCKKCKEKNDKSYREAHKENLKEYRKKYKEEHKEDLKISRKNNYHLKKEYMKEYRQKNKDKIKFQKQEYDKKYREENEYKIKNNKKEYYNSLAIFDTYAPQIEFCEEVRRDPDDSKLLQVRCTNSNCRSWFNPTNIQVTNRKQSLLINNRFYCSEECKHSCSLYRQKKYPRGFKIKNQERNPEWAEMVKERDNYECQICGSTENVVAHHYEGLNVNPLMSADIDMGITLCNQCHKRAHKDVGCRLVDLRKENICDNA